MLGDVKLCKREEGRAKKIWNDWNEKRERFYKTNFLEGRCVQPFPAFPKHRDKLVQPRAFYWQFKVVAQLWNAPNINTICCLLYLAAPKSEEWNKRWSWEWLSCARKIYVFQVHPARGGNTSLWLILNSATGSWIHFRKLTGIFPGSSFFSGMAAQAVSQSPLDSTSATISSWPEYLHSTGVKPVHCNVPVCQVQCARCSV